MGRCRVRAMRAAASAAAVTCWLVAAPSAPAAEPVAETHKVPTVGGAEINVEVMRPAGDAKAPVILTYSPYNTLSEGTSPNLANDDLGQTYVPRGYARAVADVLGTRNSSGCWDYGGADEQQSGVDVVNYLARQPWSNGKVAMIGASYDGTTANMVAARGDDAPGLAGIVPIAAISRWYGYAYGNGVRYFLNSENPTDEGFDTPLAFDFGLARTPPTDPSDPRSREKLASRANPCESVEHTLKGYDRSPDYDEFWRERDYLKDADEFRAATLIAHGWQDYNVKQDEGVRLFEALGDGVPFKRAYLFQGAHESPPGDAWQALLDAFFEHTLKGVENGVDTGPAVITEGRTVDAGGYAVDRLPRGGLLAARGNGGEDPLAAAHVRPGRTRRDRAAAGHGGDRRALRPAQHRADGQRLHLGRHGRGDGGALDAGPAQRAGPRLLLALLQVRAARRGHPARRSRRARRRGPRRAGRRLPHADTRRRRARRHACAPSSAASSTSTTATASRPPTPLPASG